MNILYHHRIASKDGQYVHVEELTNALVERGHKLTFVAPGFTEESNFGSEGGIAAKLKAKLPQWVYEILELSYSGLIAFKLIRAILAERPDCIYERYNLYQPAGVIIAKLLRLPLLLEVNAPLVDERKKYSGLALPWLAELIERFTWKNATHVLPVTEVLGAMVQDKGVAESRIDVIQNGINANLYQQLPEGVSSDECNIITIGFVGFIHPWHGLDAAIKAIATIEGKDVKLVCVGDGDIRAELEALSRDLGIADKVEFTGLKDRSEVFSYVKNFDISLQPAVTPYASPLKLFEYMAVGSLIVAPDSDNIREVLSDEHAVFFKNNDQADFAVKLGYAIENLDALHAKRVAVKALILEGKYTWQDNADRVVRIAENYRR